MVDDHMRMAFFNDYKSFVLFVIFLLFSAIPCSDFIISWTIKNTKKLVLSPSLVVDKRRYDSVV